MKALGIIRKIDHLGRIVIPKEVRNVNGWEPGTRIEMFATNEGMTFREFKMDVDLFPSIDWLETALEDATNDEDRAAIKTAINHLKKG